LSQNFTVAVWVFWIDSSNLAAASIGVS